MTTIVLISCSKKKLPHKAKAKDLYTGSLFRLSLRYAYSLNPRRIFVLSAKHGLVDLEQELDPYDLTLNEIPASEVREWAESVLDQLREEADLGKDRIVFLAGERYRKNLMTHISHPEVPLSGLSIGKQMSLLKEKLAMSDECRWLHRSFNRLTRFAFPFDENEIPKDGIYVLFEKGETAHEVDRIVRIGTHTGQGQLRPRLEQHFLNENKDRSIFRKNVGRCLLNRDNDPFLKWWEIDLTTSEAKLKYQGSIDKDKLSIVESRVSDCIRQRFTFAVFPVEEKEERLRLESRIISTISWCQECRPSSGWLGRFSPKEKITKSGLWLEQGLWKEPMSANDVDELKSYLSL